ncbi:hypothetical protein NMY22_g17027 [Coprinellus aureogranulatus]|nr:hypothetical protein NMY22_g17027 [Coprinellus aureogranulatus]
MSKFHNPSKTAFYPDHPFAALVLALVLTLLLCVFRRPDKLLLLQMLASELKEQHSACLRSLDLNVIARRPQTWSPASLVNGDSISVLSLPVVKANAKRTLQKQSCFSACPLSDCNGAGMRRPPSCRRSYGPGLPSLPKCKRDQCAYDCNRREPFQKLVYLEFTAEYASKF